ncbi:MAG: recombinase family protein [Aminipila sp.]
MEQRAAIYCRLSKEDVQKIDKGDDSQSIVNQQLLLTDFALENGFSVVKVYKDDDYSGLFDDRPEFEKLIQDAKGEKFNIIIAKSQSRFTRNMEHLEKYIHNDFPVWGIRFIGVVDHVDTAIKGNKKARQISGLINEWYCEDLSENIKAVFRAKQQTGQFLGSSTVYGYVRDPKDRHHLIIDEYAANVVRRIFSMYISGIGKAQIGAILSSEGILIPSVYKRKVLGQNYHNANANIDTKLWSFQTIHTILNNEVYIGHMVQNKCNTVSYKSRVKKAVAKENWIKVENTHEPIIDVETFQAAQDLRLKKTKKVVNDWSGRLFSKIVICSDCKKVMTGYKSKKKKDGTRNIEGYMCKTYKMFGNKFCTKHIIDEKELHDIVLNELKKEAAWLLDTDKINELEKIGSYTRENNIQMQRNKLIEQLDNIMKYKKKVYEDCVDGLLTKAEYLDYKAEYIKQEHDINTQLEQLQEQSEKSTDIHREFSYWIDRFRNYMNIDSLTREIVMEMIEKIEVHENNEIDVHFKFRGFLNTE